MGEENEKIVPSLRFPNFKDNWDQKSLSQFMTFKNGINADMAQYGHGYKFINVLDIIADKPIFHDEIIGSVAVSEKEYENNKVVYGDILFQRSSETRSEAGQSNIYLDKEKSATFGGFVIRGRPIEEFDPVFFDLLLKTSSARKEITIKSGGSTRFNVGQESLGSVLVNVTLNKEEQQKIATFLSTVDDKRNILRRKHELLETCKRGLMQRLFSQEIRFKKDDGLLFPDWIKGRIRDISRRYSSTISANSLGESLGSYKIYGASGHLKNVDFYTEESQYISIVKDGAGVGRLRMCEEKTSVLGTLDILRGKNDINLEYLYYQLLQINFSKYISGSTIPHIYYRDYSVAEIFIPSLLEQQKIANCLSALDRKIELISQQIKKMEIFKQGLLQKIFA